MSSVLAVAVEHYLERENWHYSYDEEKNIFSLKMGLKNLELVQVRIRIAEENVCSFAVLPMHIPEEKRDVVCRFITRANYGMINGNFEMDLDDGEVRYKTFFYAKDRIPVQSEIERYVDCSFLMLDRYAPGIMKILYADMDDKTAVEYVEK